jgi:beta-glucanase (GH16 family)
MWKIKKENYEKWFLQDADEFSSPELTWNMWTSGYLWGPELLFVDMLYKKENLELRDGTIAMINKRENTLHKINSWMVDTNVVKRHGKKINEDNSYTFAYSGGGLCSYKKYKYGYFEMRFKANKEQGTWPAFWLYGGEPNEEIDFYEGKGEKSDQIHIDVHCPLGCKEYRGGFLNLKKGYGAWIKLDKSLADGWNIISGEWQENYIKFFLNGIPIGYFEGKFNTSQYLIVNSAVASNYEFKPGPNENTNFPNELLVDYVRVWSKDDSLQNKNYNFKTFTNSNKSIENNSLVSAKPKGKVKFVYDKKNLDSELGTITLLPLQKNKYSLSILGDKLGEINVKIIDSKDVSVLDEKLLELNYFILNLEKFQKGTYTIQITVKNHKIEQQIQI